MDNTNIPSSPPASKNLVRYDKNGKKLSPEFVSRIGMVNDLRRKNPQDPPNKFGTHSKFTSKRTKGKNLMVMHELRTLKEYFGEILGFPIPVTMPDGSIVQKTVMDKIIVKLVAMAMIGDLKAIEMVLNRNFGTDEQRLFLKFTHEEALKELKKAQIVERVIEDKK
jgi:hypothetical protein